MAKQNDSQAATQQTEAPAKPGKNEKVKIRIHKQARTDGARRIKPGDRTMTLGEIATAGLREGVHYEKL